MDPGSTLGAVLAAFGLAGAAGANAWLPLFASALLARLDVVDMADPFDQLQTNVGLAVLGVCLIADFVGDKVPVVDSALHTLGTVIAPASGAVLFTGEANTETDMPLIVSAVAGGGVAGALHAARSVIRPISTATTAGLANPGLSALEDAASLGLTAVAFLAPLLAVIVLVALIAAGLIAWRRRRARRGAPSG